MFTIVLTLIAATGWVWSTWARRAGGPFAAYPMFSARLDQEKMTVFRLQYELVSGERCWWKPEFDHETIRFHRRCEKTIGYTVMGTSRSDLDTLAMQTIKEGNGNLDGVASLRIIARRVIFRDGDLRSVDREISTTSLLS